MALPLSTAKATKTMPGHYGDKKKPAAKKSAAKKPAAKKANPFAKKAAGSKKPAAGKAAGAKKLPPSFLKNMKKKKGSAKK